MNFFIYVPTVRFSIYKYLVTLDITQRKYLVHYLPDIIIQSGLYVSTCMQKRAVSTLLRVYSAAL